MKTKPCHCCDGSGQEIDQRALGESLRARRLKSGCSLRQVAKELGVSPSYIHDLERGNRVWKDKLMAQYQEALK